jgi:hypothetical protein
MPPKSGTNRDLFPGHSAGKGDAERSPGWRDHYDIPPSGDMTGFKRVAVNRLRKVYGRPAAPPPLEPVPAYRRVLVTNVRATPLEVWVNMPNCGVQKALLMPDTGVSATLMREHEDGKGFVVAFDLGIFGGIACHVAAGGLTVVDV